MKIAECSRVAIYLLEFTIKYDHHLSLPRTHSHTMMMIIITVCAEAFGEKVYTPEHSTDGTNITALNPNNKEIFPVYGGKCLSRKAVHKWFEKRLADDERWKRRPGSGSDNSQKTSTLRVSTHCKAMGQVYQCWWRICREMNVFSRFEHRMFYVLYPFVWPVYWLSLVLLPPKGGTTAEWRGDFN
jgi:hypothetical protein